MSERIKCELLLKLPTGDGKTTQIIVLSGEDLEPFQARVDSKDVEGLKPGDKITLLEQLSTEGDALGRKYKVVRE